MAWIYFQAVEGLPKDFTDGSRLSLTVKSSEELSACSCREWRAGKSMPHLSGMTCLLCGGLCSRQWTLSQGAFHARTSALQAMERDWEASEADLCLNTSASLASADLDSYSWKTYQLSLFGGSTRYCWDSMRWGMMRDGQLFQPQKWAPRTEENESGYLPIPGTHVPTPTATAIANARKASTPGSMHVVSLAHFAVMYPTPTATPYGSNQSPSEGATVRLSLDAMARNDRWPTPTCTDAGVMKARPPEKMVMRDGRKALRAQNLGETLGGSLNPTWVEWLMGWPIGATVCESWVMESSHFVQKKPSRVSGVS